MLIKKPFGLVLILIFFPDLKQIALKTPTTLLQPWKDPIHLGKKTSNVCDN